MKVVGNVLWLVLAGIWLALGYLIAGVLSCCTVICIPFGIQSFKLAGYALWPFGKVVVQRKDADAALGCLGNAIWFVFGGLWMAIGHVIAGVILCFTVVGIPFGIASFKMAGLALAPFGKQIVERRSLAPGAEVVAAGPAPLGEPELDPGLPPIMLEPVPAKQPPGFRPPSA